VVAVSLKKQGLGDRALEMPNGSDVAVAPEDRARIRYNHPKLQLEQSIHRGAYVPLSTVPSQEILDQTSWYISTSGDDGNDGAAAGSALRTHAELMRRIGGGQIDVMVTIHILHNALAAEDCHAVWNVGPNGFVRYRGYVISTLASGTLTAVTDIDKPNNIPFDITDTGLSDTWANLGLINQRIRITSGVREGAIAWSAKDLGAKKARVSEWKVTAYPPTYDYVTVNAQVGDPYAVESLPSIKDLRVNVSLANDEGIGAFSRISFEDLDIAPVSNVLTINPVSVWCDNVEGAVFFNSSISRITSVGGMRLINCQIGFVDNPRFSLISFIGGLVSFALALGYVSQVSFRGLTVQSSFGVTIDSGLLHINDILDSGGVGVFDMSGSAIRVIRGGIVEVSAPVYGSGVGDYTFQVSENSSVVYVNVAELTAVATIDDTRIGGTAKAYGALPFFNATNGSKMVVAAF
jgi:hypothetical protein